MILALNLLIMQVATWVLVPSATFLNFLWVAATNIVLFRGHFLINAARLLGVGFNAEVTTSPGIAPPPCSHGWPTVLVLFFLGMPWEAVFKGMLPFLLMISVGRGQDCPRRYLLAVWTLFVHLRVFLPPRHGPWALYEVGRGCWVLWTHNSPSKFRYPAPRTERRVLMSSGFRHGLSSPILHQC